VRQWTRTFLWSSVIKGWLIDELVKRTAVNIHMGVSPFYGGSSTNFWALTDDNPHLVGATVHLFSAGVDLGDILFHGGVRPDGCTDAFDLGMAAVRDAQTALVRCIEAGVVHELPAVAQDVSQEIRYNRNAEFTDEVAAHFLQDPSSLDHIFARLRKTEGQAALIPVPVTF
jgi:methionyl-tRNA formyltransferase